MRSRKRLNVKVEVGLGDRAYDILVGAGLLGETGALAARVLPAPRKSVVITDKKIGGLYGKTLVASLKGAGYEVSVIEVPVGERYKSLSVAGGLYGRLLELEADRTTLIAALGGGVVGDLTGFTAATYMRGVPFIQIPTSLLAQVDSSVGGKTAVNHPSAKNIIGAFYQPRLVVVDTDVLTTLPAREFRAGMSEIIKYALISGGDLLAKVRDFTERVPKTGATSRTRAAAVLRDRAALEKVIVECCSFKAKVVEKDEFDEGLRAVLNYGHTIGHALEAVAGYRRYNHGEGVAVGMIGAALIARRLGMLGNAEVALHRELVGGVGLPAAAPGIDAGAVFSHLRKDKKRLSGRDRFVLLNGVGSPEVHDVDAGLIKETIANLTRAEDI